PVAGPFSQTVLVAPQDSRNPPESGRCSTHLPSPGAAEGTLDRVRRPERNSPSPAPDAPEDRGRGGCLECPLTLAGSPGSPHTAFGPHHSQPGDRQQPPGHRESWQCLAGLLTPAPSPGSPATAFGPHHSQPGYWPNSPDY